MVGDSVGLDVDGEKLGLIEGAVVVGDSVGLDVDGERVGPSVSPG